MEQLDSPQGWRVVGGAHAITGITFGSAYAFSALFPALSAEFDASRGEVSLVFSLAAVIYYWLGAVSGPLADRVPTRWLVMAGVLALVVGSIGASRATSLPQLYLWYGAGVGLGIGLSYVPAIGAVQSWFVRLRSRASGVATAGLGVGTLILPLVVGQGVGPLGWRTCLLGLAAMAALIGVPAAFVMRKRNEADVLAAARAGTGTGRIGPRDAWRDPRFRRFYATLILASFCTFIPYVHIVPAARDLGLSLEAGTALIGIVGVGNVFGRFVLSGFGDRIGRYRLLAILTFSVAASFAIWAMATGFYTLALFAVVFGMSYGGCVGLYPSVASDLFGTTHIGAMLGYAYSAVGVAALVGPPLAGVIFDRTGSYLGPIAASALAAVVAGAMTLSLGTMGRGEAAARA